MSPARLARISYLDLEGSVLHPVNGMGEIGNVRPGLIRWPRSFTRTRGRQTLRAWGWHGERAHGTIRVTREKRETCAFSHVIALGWLGRTEVVAARVSWWQTVLSIVNACHFLGAKRNFRPVQVFYYLHNVGA